MGRNLQPQIRVPTLEQIGVTQQVIASGGGRRGVERAQGWRFLLKRLRIVSLELF